MTDTTTRPPSPTRSTAAKLAGVVAALVGLLALAVALTDLTASDASGMLAGALVGGSGAALASWARHRAARSSLRRGEDARLDQLEPLRRDQP